jgi:hypothetical protein
MEPYTFQTELEGGGVAAAIGDAETRAAGTVDSASSLAVGAFEAGGGEDVDFWRVQLTGGDRLVVNVTAPSSSYYFDLYSPETTTSSFLENPPVDHVSVYGEGQVILQAPYTGSFVLAVCEDTDNGDCRGYANSGTKPVEPYIFQTELEGGGVAAAAANAETRATESIDSASSLAVGAFEAGGGEDVDFWRVQLTGGDRLLVNVTAPSSSYYFDLYSPETTTSSFLENPPVEHGSTYGEGQVVLQVPYTGNFVLAVCEDTDDGDCRDDATSGTKPIEPYTFQTQLEA